MARQLIIVESPAKVKTIGKFLSNDYKVTASVGHVRDLPSKSLGVDEGNGFAPQYEIIDNKRDVVNALRRDAAKADIVYLAPDPDREGEAIAWHVAELIRDQAREIKRIQFNEITRRAVLDAIEHPRDLDENLFEAQQARRILDRLVGYKISPLLWKTIKRGLSAGRVQSVALRLIADREKEREAFIPKEYWPFHALLAAEKPPVFKAELFKDKGKKIEIASAAEADAFRESIKGKPFVVAEAVSKEKSRSPQPPYITSTLQQAANQKHGYSAKRTMQIAQKLYEGVELGDRGLTALITYMRTDSTRVSDEARAAAKNFILDQFGQEYLPPKPRVYKAKQSAQDAHEAIRPVDASIAPEMIKDFLAPDQYNIYKLVWTRFIASQMAAARINETLVLIECGESLWRAKGEQVIFDGYLKVMPKNSADETPDLPPLTRGQVLKLEKLEFAQKFTQPPARYSEATLVKELEDKGIGRPSTYAAIISTLLDREYVKLEDKRLAPTDLGRVVCDQLVTHFQRLMDAGFTAKMEEGLDKVAEGAENWIDLLTEFAADFNPTLDAAQKNMASVKKGIPAGLPCPQCSRPLLIKFGKAGDFLACSGYPECSFTCNFSRDEQGQVAIMEKEPPKFEKAGECPKCGKDLLVKRSRIGGRFIACSGYPDCSYTASLSTGVLCPACGKGQMVEKTSKRGKVFFACDQYPACDFALWQRPVPVTCPRCGSPYLLDKKTRDGEKLVCPKQSCGYSEDKSDA
ncbi:MAG: type I DNA topoisomerase [Desulfovibrio sp.]|nr:type I DNA topoisomerase [Desulfovibrio sp.]